MTIEKSSFVEQLRRRHVFRVAAMYAVTSWLLLQIGSVTFEPLGFPVWSQRALIILVAVGFPIALALAWIFDVTPEGVIRGAASPTIGLSRGRKLDIVVIVVLFAALGVTWLWRREPASAPPVIADASIAVLPFIAMGNDAVLGPLGEGLAEQITDELARRSELRVASRTSAFKAAQQDTVAIARTLGVSFVLEGSVRPADDRLRITAQLVRGSDGLHVWSNPFDVAMNNTAEQDRTATTIALMAYSYIELERDLQRARQQTTNAEAYEQYASARRLRWQMATGGVESPHPYEQIIDDLDRALSLDPDFVPALLLRANAYTNRLGTIACAPQCGIEARHSIDRVLALHPDDPAALHALGANQLIFELDPAAADATFERLRRLEPQYPYLNEDLARVAMFRGDVAKARDYWARQVAFRPYLSSQHLWYCRVLVTQGDYDAAEHECDVALQLAPVGQDHVAAAAMRIVVLISRGEIDKAKAELAPLWAQYRYASPASFGRVLGLLGYEREAHELVTRLSQDPTVDPLSIFATYYGLGDYDNALVWMRRAIDQRSSLLLLLRLAYWSQLQELPEYTDVLVYLDSQQRSH